MRNWGIIAAGITLVLDQLVKYWLQHSFMQPPRIVEVFPFFNLVAVWNHGVSFGMFASSGLGAWLFIALAIGVVAGLAHWLWRVQNAVLALGLGCIIGGALGNVIDRIVYGAVYDYLDFYWKDWHWPAFNLADIGICFGVFLLLIDVLRGPDKSAK